MITKYKNVTENEKKKWEYKPRNITKCFLVYLVGLRGLTVLTCF
jgi:hypothetical protein